MCVYCVCSAGTGLLSMMAARAMCNGDSSTTCRSTSSSSSSSEGMITACESYLPMVKLMRKVARLNGMERKIKVFNKRSDELQVGVDIPSRADILVGDITLITRFLFSSNKLLQLKNILNASD